MQSEIDASVSSPVYLVQIGFQSTTLYLSSLRRNITWNGQTWLGNSWLRPVRPINETADIRAVGIEIELVGVSSSLLSIALQNIDQSKDAYQYLGMLDSNGEIIEDPVLLFKGKVDTVQINDALQDPTITIQCESPYARLLRPNNFRYTSENQKALFAGDRGFEYVPGLEDWTGFWGKPERPKWLKRKRVVVVANQ